MRAHREAETDIAGAISSWKPVVAHLCTVDSSLRYLLLPQLRAIRDLQGEAIGISGPGPDVEFLESEGIRHIALTASTREQSLLSDLRASIQLWKALRRERPDVLHTHNPKPGLYGRVVGRLSGVPVVVNTVHGLYATENDSIWKRSAVYILEFLAGIFSDLEFVQSSEDVDTIRRLRLAHSSKVEHLGNGIDLQRFEPQGTDDRSRRIGHEVGLPPDSVVVGCVARLVAEKGIPELIDAWRSRTTDYQLVVVGPEDPSKHDALDPALLARARDEGAVFLGHRDDIDELYQAFDVFVLPSHREGFPRAAMEAAASGLPVVATDVRGCREVVDDGENGLLVPKRDAPALASAIETLVKDRELRRRMGAVGRAKAVEDFDEAEVVRKVLSGYLRVARKKGVVGE